jgi:threonine/homoserine/homoserine lactone efflux protein
MSSGVNFGVRPSLPLLSGICCGFALMLIIVAMGFAQIFTLFPHIITVIKILGTSYLVYLAWVISQSTGLGDRRQQSKPLGFIQGAMFQWVNGKAWVVAIGAVTAFNGSAPMALVDMTWLAGIFLLVAFPCVGIWLGFGTLLRQYLADETRLKRFNYLMSGLLLLSIVPIVTEIIDSLTNKA